MKTIKQIADELKIDKQKVYRYIKKNHINDAHQINGVMHFDDAVVTLVKSAFTEEKPHHEAHHDVHQNHINDAVIDVLKEQTEILKKELEIKNKQIEELTIALRSAQESLQASQVLQATSQKMLLEEDTQEKKKKWWHFGK